MTSSGVDQGPFHSDPVEHVPLAGAPLAKVVCQLRWPQLTAFQANADSLLESFSAAVSPEFPVFNRQHEMNVVVTPAGMSQQSGGELFHFTSADQAWSLALSDSFLALETTQYTSRDDFIAKLLSAFAVLSDIVEIPYLDRIGYRYINRVYGQAVTRINETVNERVRGERVPLADGAKMIHTLSETIYQVNDAQLLARWAILPINVTVDPSLPPVNSPSWVLDLDSYSDGWLASDKVSVAETAERLAEIGYKFFRWSVNTEFLRQFGGEV